MLTNPMDILTLFPVRKTRCQKENFRSAVRTFGEQLGYTVIEEKGTFGSCNLLFGDPENAEFLITAHYDTPTRSLIPNFCTPCNGLLYLLRLLCSLLCSLASVVVIAVAAAFLAGKWIIRLVCIALILLMYCLCLFGPANKNNVNDNASGVITVLEIMKTLPENQRSKVCFVLFDLEEAGLIGSGSYRKKHKEATEHQLVLNLDCVGDGDYLRMFPTKQLKKDRYKCTSLYKACGYFGRKELLVQENGFCLYPSDQRRFPYGVGICALNRRKKLLYLNRIHTSKDTVLDFTNVNILRAALTTYVCRDAADRKEI